MKVTKYLDWVLFVMRQGPHTSLWMTENGLEGLYAMGEKVVWWCLANSQASQEITSLVEICGNKVCKL